MKVVPSNLAGENEAPRFRVEVEITLAALEGLERVAAGTGITVEDYLDQMLASYGSLEVQEAILAERARHLLNDGRPLAVSTPPREWC